jgi:hypothetical protein
MLKYIIVDEFKAWWKDRHSILGRFMVRKLIEHRRKGLTNPYIMFENEEEYPKELKRITRLLKKGQL